MAFALPALAAGFKMRRPRSQSCAAPRPYKYDWASATGSAEGTGAGGRAARGLGAGFGGAAGGVFSLLDAAESLDGFAGADDSSPCFAALFAGGVALASPEVAGLFAGPVFAGDDAGAVAVGVAPGGFPLGAEAVAGCAADGCGAPEGCAVFDGCAAPDAGALDAAGGCESGVMLEEAGAFPSFELEPDESEFCTAAAGLCDPRFSQFSP